MSLVLGGISSMDRMVLSRALEERGVSFEVQEDEVAGHGDMGLFLIIVPLTASVASVLKTWIKTRGQKSKIVIKDGSKEINAEGTPDEIRELLALIDNQQ